MRELRFVSRNDDGSLLLESPDGLDDFHLAVDDAVRDAVTPRRMPAPAPAPTRSSSPHPITSGTDAVSPREVQMRVRAGESPESLAAEHGVPVERVMRFAGPVLAERARITDEARRARARHTGNDESEARVVVFGETVDRRFAAHGIDAETVSWDARRRDDGEWIVLALWEGGEGSHDARWLFTRSSRTVTPLDDTAADLLSDRPIRPVAPAVTPRPPVTAPHLAPGVIAFPPFPDAHTGPIPRVEQVFDQEDTRDMPRRTPLTTVGRRTAGSAPASGNEQAREATVVDTTDDITEPPLPLTLTDRDGHVVPEPDAADDLFGRRPTPSATRRADSEDDKAARARIPSWDDILLGVRRKQD